ncbi:MAG: glycosyltransferase, partial [Pseudomonadota bacterium]
MSARFSVVIPTRNRQRYAVEAVRSILLAERADVEIILCDNSDDPTALPRLLAEAGVAERVRLLESPGAHLSMRENWERAIAVLSGEWVAYIGDDDGVTPFAFTLADAVIAAFDVRVFSWIPSYYRWPCFPASVAGMLEYNAFDFEIGFQTGAGALLDHQDWRTGGKWPALGPSIYHAFVHRSVIEEVKAKHGEYFISFVVDYGAGVVNAQIVDHFIVLNWPLSIMGACGRSNTAGLTGSGEAPQRIRDTRKENPDVAPFYPEFADSRLHAPWVIAGYRDIMARVGLPFGMTRDKFLASTLVELRTVREAEIFEAEKARLIAFRDAHGLRRAELDGLTLAPTAREMGAIKAPELRLRMDTRAFGWTGIYDVASNIRALI